MGDAGPAVAPSVPYKPPSWAAVPKGKLWFDVMRSGTLIDTIEFGELDCLLFGRLNNCDVPMDHPSISRYHAVVQCGDDGNVYVYDLGSTHGTKINKTALEPRKYTRLRVGHMVKFGQSSRLYLLQAPDDVVEAEQDELEAARDRAVERKAVLEQAAQEEEARGVSWGMDSEDDPSEGNTTAVSAPKAIDDGGAFYLEDPKKALRTYFEREATSLDYEVEETGPGHARVYTCQIRLPIESDDGESLIVNASVQGKRRDAIAAAALEACRTLDARGVLRGDGAAKVREAKRKAKANSDDEDDTFFDRTGDIEAKRLRKARRAERGVVTYEGLCERKGKLVAEITAIRESISAARAEAQRAQDESGLDPLDAFLKGMQSNTHNVEVLARQRRLERELQRELTEIEGLMAITKPALDPVAVASTKVPGPAVDTESEQPPNSTNDMVTDSSSGLQPTESKSTTADEAPASLTPVTTSSLPAVPPAVDNPSKQHSELPTVPSVPEDVKTQIKTTEFAEPALPAPKPAKKRRVYNVARPSEAQLEAAQAAVNRKEGVANSSWVAPENQSGDGRTALNDKLGY